MIRDWRSRCTIWREYWWKKAATHRLWRSIETRSRSAKRRFVSLRKGNFKEAETWLEKALAVWEKSAGSQAYAAVAMNNLALLRKLEGSSDKAENLYKQALAIEEKAFGREHPEVATTLMSLAALYRTQAKREQAVAMYKSAVALLEKTVGSQAPLAIEAREQLSGLMAP